MYNYDDIKVIENRFKKFLLFFALATLLFAVIVIAVCRNWGTVLDPIRLPSWPAYAFAVIYAVYAVFVWGMIGSKLLKYRKFVYGILNGRERMVEGKIMSVSDEKSNDNDLEFYYIEIKEEDAEENRLLKLDALKDVGVFKEGENVKLKIFGNYIKDITS